MGSFQRMNASTAGSLSLGACAAPGLRGARCRRRRRRGRRRPHAERRDEPQRVRHREREERLQERLDDRLVGGRCRRRDVRWIGRRDERARVAQRDRGGVVGVGLRVDVRAGARARVGRRPARRPEADVDEHAQAAAADGADRAVQRPPARLLVGAGIAGVEAGGLGRLVGRARQRGPAGGDPDRVDAQRLGLCDRGLDLGDRPEQEEPVVLEDRLEAALDDRGLAEGRGGLLRLRRARRALLVVAARGDLHGRGREQPEDERDHHGMRGRAPHAAKSAG